ncbi:MAG: protein kinase [Deltaproteobacteria bacterium]|nr:protein kinase [Deltaproteobacteria bacterium]
MTTAGRPPLPDETWIALLEASISGVEGTKDASLLRLATETLLSRFPQQVPTTLRKELHPRAADVAERILHLVLRRQVDDDGFAVLTAINCICQTAGDGSQILRAFSDGTIEPVGRRSLYWMASHADDLAAAAPRALVWVAERMPADGDQHEWYLIRHALQYLKDDREGLRAAAAVLAADSRTNPDDEWERDEKGDIKPVRRTKVWELKLAGKTSFIVNDSEKSRDIDHAIAADDYELRAVVDRFVAAIAADPALVAALDGTSWPIAFWRRLAQRAADDATLRPSLWELALSPVLASKARKPLAALSVAIFADAGEPAKALEAAIARTPDPFRAVLFCLDEEKFASTDLRAYTLKLRDGQPRASPDDMEPSYGSVSGAALPDPHWWLRLQKIDVEANYETIRLRDAADEFWSKHLNDAPTQEAASAIVPVLADLADAITKTPKSSLRDVLVQGLLRGCRPLLFLEDANDAQLELCRTALRLGRRRSESPEDEFVDLACMLMEHVPTLDAEHREWLESGRAKTEKGIEVVSSDFRNYLIALHRFDADWAWRELALWASEPPDELLVRRSMWQFLGVRRDDVIALSIDAETRWSTLRDGERLSLGGLLAYAALFLAHPAASAWLEKLATDEIPVRSLHGVLWWMREEAWLSGSAAEAPARVWLRVVTANARARSAAAASHEIILSLAGRLVYELPDAKPLDDGAKRLLIQGWAGVLRDLADVVAINAQEVWQLLGVVKEWARFDALEAAEALALLADRREGSISGALIMTNTRDVPSTIRHIATTVKGDPIATSNLLAVIESLVLTRHPKAMELLPLRLELARSTKQNPPRNEGRRMLRDDVDFDTAISALARCVVATFDEQRWHALARVIGRVNLTKDFPRLLRAMNFDDDDYPAEVLRALRAIVGKDRNILQLAADQVAIDAWLKDAEPTLYSNIIARAEPVRAGSGPAPMSAILTRRARDVLTALQDKVVESGTGAERHAFRMSYLDNRIALDKLHDRGLVRVEGADHYHLTRLGLLACRSPNALADLRHAVDLIEPLRARYVSDPDAALGRVDDFGTPTVPPAAVTRALRVLADVPKVWPVEPRGARGEDGVWTEFAIRESILDVTEAAVFAEREIEDAPPAPVQRPLRPDDVQLLRHIAVANAAGTFPEKKRFRVEHLSQRRTIDELVGMKLIDDAGDRFRLTRRGLVLSDSDDGRQLLLTASKVLVAAREAFKQSPDKRWPFEELALRASVSALAIAPSMYVLNEARQGMAWTGMSGGLGRADGDVHLIEKSFDIEVDDLANPSDKESPPSPSDLRLLRAPPEGPTLQVPPFRNLRRLGAGAHGATYEAEEVALGRVVAIKFLNPSAPTALTAATQARALARAGGHSNVVTVLRLANLPNPATAEVSECIVMERIVGPDLATVLRSSLDRARVDRIGTGLVAGLRHIHQAGLTHGDLHDENVLIVAQQDRPIIIDLQYWSSRATMSTVSRDAAIVADVRKLSGLLTDLVQHAASLDVAQKFRQEARKAQSLDELEALFRSALEEQPAAARTSDLEIKRRVRAELIEPLGGPNAKRRTAFSNQEVIIRSVDDKTYPSHDETNDDEISPWFKLLLFDTYHAGIECLRTHADVVIAEDGRWAPVEPEFRTDERVLKHPHRVRAHVIACIPYRNIADIDQHGDEYYGGPHIFCRFVEADGSPYEQTRYRLVTDDYPPHLPPDRRASLEDLLGPPLVGS